MKFGLLGLVFLGIGLFFINGGNFVFGVISAVIGFGFMLRYMLISKSLKKRDENSEKNPMNDSFLPPH